MGIFLVCTVDDVPYLKRLARLLTKFCFNEFPSTAAELKLTCTGNYFYKELFPSNHKYWARDIYFAV